MDRTSFINGVRIQMSYTRYHFEFKFVNGYVVNHTPNILLIDNSDRLKHDKKIKEIESLYFSLYDLIFCSLIVNCFVLLDPPEYKKSTLEKLLLTTGAGFLNKTEPSHALGI